MPSVHAELDDLQGHLAPDRLLLFGHIDDAEATLADPLQQLIPADDRPRTLAETLATGRDSLLDLPTPVLPPSTSASPTPDQPDNGFLKYLPAVEMHARITFRHLREEAKEEAVAEAVASAFCNYVSLARRGRIHVLKKTMMASFAALRVKDGYHVGGRRDRKREALCWQAARQGGYKVHSLHDSRDYLYDCLSTTDHPVWRLVLLEDRRTPVLDQVAFRVDWSMFLSRLSDRTRQIINMLAAGHRRSEVIDKFGFTSAALCQRLRRVRRAWNAFQGCPESVPSQ